MLMQRITAISSWSFDSAFEARDLRMPGAKTRQGNVALHFSNTLLNLKYLFSKC
jgi:hypothetical protein